MMRFKYEYNPERCWQFLALHHHLASLYSLEQITKAFVTRIETDSFETAGYFWQRWIPGTRLLETHICMHREIRTRVNYLKINSAVMLVAEYFGACGVVAFVVDFPKMGEYLRRLGWREQIEGVMVARTDTGADQWDQSLNHLVTSLGAHSGSTQISRVTSQLRRRTFRRRPISQRLGNRRL